MKPQNLFAVALALTLAILSWGIQMDDEVASVLREEMDYELETPREVERALANAILSERAIVFLHMDWAPMGPQRAFYADFIADFHRCFPDHDVRFHYVDCTPITYDYTPLTSLPGWPGSGRMVYRQGTGGGGDVVWIDHGVVRHVETIFESRDIADLTATTQRIFRNAADGT